MSLYDNASLVMIPSGVKEDKLYSVKPTDGSGDFTFSRGSDIQATRVNSSGLIEKARVSLFSYNTDFTNAAWTKQLSTIVADQIANPINGATDADLFYPSNSGNYKAIRRATPTNPSAAYYGISIYAKAQNKSHLHFVTSGGTKIAAFNLSDGSTSTGVGFSVVAESLANDWYRCSVSAITEELYMCVADGLGTTSVTANGTDGIYIWGLQLEYGITKDFIGETTTTAVVEGLTADLPRLDYHNPDSPTPNSCSSLLLEPSRTNLIDYSEYYNVNWGLTRLSVNDNSTTSPEGVGNASLLIPDTSGSATHRMRRAVSLTAGQNYTFSCFFKKENYAYAQLRSGTGWQINVDLNDGSFTTSGTSLVDGDVEDYGNGWYRAYVVGTEAGTSQGFDISVFNSDSFGGFAGDGTSGVYAYGAQVEQGSYPTSYIPTYGAAANRGADNCVKTGISSLIGQSEGVVFLDFTYKPVFDDANSQTTHRFSLSDGTYTNRITLYPNNSNGLGVLATGVVFTGSFSMVDGQRYKVALAYGDTSVVYINGVEVFGYVSGTPTGGYDRMQFADATNTLTRVFGSPVNQALLFKTRLTNAELAALTTI